MVIDSNLLQRKVHSAVDAQPFLRIASRRAFDCKKDTCVCFLWRLFKYAYFWKSFYSVFWRLWNSCQFGEKISISQLTLLIWNSYQLCVKINLWFWRYAGNSQIYFMVGGQSWSFGIRVACLFVQPPHRMQWKPDIWHLPAEMCLLSRKCRAPEGPFREVHLPRGLESGPRHRFGQENRQFPADLWALSGGHQAFKTWREEVYQMLQVSPLTQFF